MIVDSKLKLADSQAVTSTGAEVVATTNYIDTESAASNYGAGAPLYFRFLTEVAHASTAAGTLAFLVQGSPTSTAWTTLTGTGALLEADLPAGTVKYLGLPEGNYRYLRGAYNLSAATEAGTYSVDITPDKQPAL